MDYLSSDLLRESSLTRENVIAYYLFINLFNSQNQNYVANKELINERFVTDGYFNEIVNSPDLKKLTLAFILEDLRNKYSNEEYYEILQSLKNNVKDDRINHEILISLANPVTFFEVTIPEMADNWQNLIDQFNNGGENMEEAIWYDISLKFYQNIENLTSILKIISMSEAPDEDSAIDQ